MQESQVVEFIHRSRYLSRYLSLRRGSLVLFFVVGCVTGQKQLDETPDLLINERNVTFNEMPPSCRVNTAYRYKLFIVLWDWLRMNPDSGTIFRGQVLNEYRSDRVRNRISLFCHSVITSLFMHYRCFSLSVKIYRLLHKFIFLLTGLEKLRKDCSSLLQPSDP